VSSPDGDPGCATGRQKVYDVVRQRVNGKRDRRQDGGQVFVNGEQDQSSMLDDVGRRHSSPRRRGDAGDAEESPSLVSGSGVGGSYREARGRASPPGSSVSSISWLMSLDLIQRQ
jgi:hypothetical protein